MMTKMRKTELDGYNATYILISGELGYNICKCKLSFPIIIILDPKSTSPTLIATDSNYLKKYLKCIFQIDYKYLWYYWCLI